MVKQIYRARDYILKKDALLALILGIALILAVISLGTYSNLVIPGNSAPSARYLQEPATHLDFLSEWDGPNYIYIANHGYTNKSLTAFFPLYPLLIGVLRSIIHSPLISGLIISWACLVGALYFYIKIIKTLIDSDQLNVVKRILIFLLFPTAVFLVATYTESLFALGALGAIYFGLKKNYLLAGVFTAITTATHPNGVFILALIAILLWEARLPLWKIASYCVLGSVGIASYMSYLWITKNNPLDFVSAEKGGGWLSSNYFHSIISSFNALDLLLIALVITTIIYWWNKRKSFALYSLLYLLLPIVGGNYSGYPRYLLMLFPLQIMIMKKIRLSSLAYSLILIATTIIWSYFVIQYSAGYTGGS